MSLTPPVTHWLASSVQPCETAPAGSLYPRMTSIPPVTPTWFEATQEPEPSGAGPELF